MSVTRSTFSAWNPRHWPVLAGLGLFHLLQLLPWRAQAALGTGLGWFAYHFVRVRRGVVATNLRLAFPEKSNADRASLARAHYRSLGRGMFETCLAWWAPSHRMPPHEIIGLEHLRAAQARDKGVLLLTAHFTTLEICGRLLVEQLPIGCLYRNPDNPVIADNMRAARETRMAVAVHMDDLRGLLRALKQGHAVWYAPDQGKRTKFTVILPFFGVPARTNTATSRIASMTGAAVVPYFGTRRKDGVYELRILPALENFPSDDVEADSLRINRLFEDEIRRAPAQYFWVHRRFKLGSKETDVYARD